MKAPETIDELLPSDPDATVAPTGGTSSNVPEIPGFVILDELGRGGMGVVYRARQTALDRIVALKLVLSGGHASADELTRFRREAEAVARFQHANIVQIYEVGDDAGLPYFALEFVPGGTLARKLLGSPLPPREAAKLVEALARAVEHAHAKGVVHRDLKPGNVLLTADGTPKVADFGLAKRLDGGDSRTATGAILGTPSYMAPEQAGSGDAVGPAADVYALGAILYECLTGRPPFRAATPFDTILQVLTDDPVSPLRLMSSTPRDLNTVVLKCLEKSPGKRYPSAAALADDLRRYLDGEPVRARPVGRFERGWKWAKRRPAAAALIAVSVFALLGLFGGGLWANANLQRLIAAVQRERATVLRGQYAANVILAQKAADADDWGRACELLDACKPRPGDEDLRGFEWHYLNGLGDVAVLTADNAWDCAWTANGATLAVLGVEPAKEPSHFTVRLVTIADGNSRRLARTPILLNSTLHGGDFVASPDGSRLALSTGGGGSNITIWDAVTGEATPSLDCPKNCTLPTLSREGKRLAAVGTTQDGNGVVFVWDVATGRKLLEHSLDNRPVTALAFDRTGDRLAALGPSEGSAWHLASGRGSGWQPTPRFYANVSSPDPLDPRLTGVATYGFDVQECGRPVPPAFVVHGRGTRGDFDVAATDTPFFRGLPLAPRLGRNTRDEESVVWQRDGQLLGAMRGTVAYLGSPGDAVAGRVVLRGHTSDVDRLTFAPDGRHVATLGGRQVKVWRTTPAAHGLVRDANPAGAVRYDNRVVFSPDGQSVAATRADGSLAVYDARTGATLAEFRDSGRRLDHPTFFPDGRRLVALPRQDGPAEILVLNRDAPASPARRVAVGGGRGFCLAVRPDGQQAAVIVATPGVANSSHVGLVDLSENAPAATILLALKDASDAVAYSPDGLQLVGAYRGGLARWVLPVTAGPTSLVKSPNEPVRSIRFSPDGRSLVTAGNRVIIYESDTGAVRTILATSAADARYGPDGRRLFTLDERGVRVWDAASVQELLTIRTDDPAEPASFRIGFPSALALSPDGLRVAVVSGEGGIRIWDLTKPTLAEIDRRDAVVGKD